MALTEWQREQLRKKARAAGHKLPSDKPKAKKKPVKTEREKEMERLKAEKAALEARGGRKEPTRTTKETPKQKQAAKARKASKSASEKLLERARKKEGMEYFKRRK